MKTYTKQDFHNPEQLTRQQVGEKYRLLLPEELDGRFTSGNSTGEFFIFSLNSWRRVSCVNKEWTFRIPLATPLPDGTVLSSNECCWSDTKPSDPRKVVYCCGPMSNMIDYNFPAFFEAAAELEKQGYKVINPAQMDLDSGWTLEEIKDLDVAQFQEFLKGAAKRDLDALQQCDAIALLPGWESSKGARAEKAVAEWLGLETIYLKGEAPTEPKQPYNGDERAEWDVSGLIPKIQSSIAPDDPKGAAGALKAPMWLLPAHSLQQTAWVHKLGSEKYGPYNWRKTSVCVTTYISAIMRHLDAWRDGEDNDPESGISHIAHVAASCNILLDAQHCGKLNDDRAKLCQI